MADQNLHEMLTSIKERVDQGKLTPDQAYTEFQDGYVRIMRGSVVNVIGRLVKALAYVWFRDSGPSDEDRFDEAMVLMEACLSDDEMVFSDPFYEGRAEKLRKLVLETLSIG